MYTGSEKLAIEGNVCVGGAPNIAKDGVLADVAPEHSDELHDHQSSIEAVRSPIADQTAPPLQADAGAPPNEQGAAAASAHHVPSQSKRWAGPRCAFCGRGNDFVRIAFLRRARCQSTGAAPPGS
jgi:hypothetical protein